jgi:hypothetical protein
MTKILFAVFTVLLGSSPLMAGVLMELDNQEYTDLARVEYQVGSKNIEVSFDQLHRCQPSAGAESNTGLTLRIGQELYPLSGSITLGLIEGGLRLRLSSSSGDIMCEGDTIFHDWFVPLGGVG